MPETDVHKYPGFWDCQSGAWHCRCALAAREEAERLRALLREVYRRLSAASATEESELETDWNQAIQACLLLIDEAALEG